jgi:3-keto-disaccharide hydrolase
MQRWFWAGVWVFAVAIPARADEPAWIPVMAKDLDAFKPPHGDWQPVSEVTLDAANPRKLVGKEGSGAWYNGPKGRTNNLYTKQKYGDLEVSLEFMMSKGSNSGIKFHGHYEIQILDSFGKKELTGDDCGGVYPRADIIKGRYTHLDKGIAPRINACKAPGEWQSLDVTFLAPRFDKYGKKIKNAMIEKALLNGQVIHDKQELLTPTGDRWKNKEMYEGPLMVQADHGPVAFRNMTLRVLK